MTDKHDLVVAIASSLYASRATDDALRAKPSFDAIANEAWSLYHKLERAVRNAEAEAHPEADLSEAVHHRGRRRT
jgi:hypothetical protein